MKKFLTLTAIFCLLILSKTSAQCPPANINIVLPDQTDVDSFAINYPDCTELQSNLFIGNANSGGTIYNLNGLANITMINGNLSINDNTAATMLELSGLNYVSGYLDISSNTANIILNSLTAVQGSVSIDYNDSESIELNNLTSAGEPSSGGSSIINISDNSGLSNIGLNSLTYVVGNFHFEHNDSLQSLLLNNLSTLAGGMTISENYSLTEVVFSNLDTINGSLMINDNAALVHLTGFDNLSEAGGTSFIVENNDLLQSIVLNNLNVLSGNLTISENYSLTEVRFDNLDTIANRLTISENYSLAEVSFDNLDVIARRLTIRDNETLAHLAGLSNLDWIGEYLLITNNAALSDLNGLSNITEVEVLTIGDNTILANLEGLNNVNTVDELNITNNPALVSLEALSNLTNINSSLQIAENSSLTSLTGLDNVSFPTDATLGIFNNQNLSYCSIPFICNHFINGGTIGISGNASGCADLGGFFYGCSYFWEYAIEGNVFMDNNNDCIKDISEADLDNWVVKAESETNIFYTYTYNAGKYAIPVDTGTYTVTAIPPNSLWEDVCFESNTAVLTPFSTRDTIDFGASTGTFCPLLEVDVTAPFVRRCFDSSYYVSYCNSGTAVAENAYVEVQLDPFFTYQNATITGTDLGDNLYSFDVGNIDVSECGSFQIDVYVDCDSTVIGQTHCVEAHIFPDSICTPTSPLWDESSVVVDARCLGDSIEFKIENIGTGDMSDSLEYLVVEDDLIWRKANFRLDSGDSLKFYEESNGLFYRLEAEQSPGHPGNSMPSVFVEGCGEGDNGEISIGFVNSYLLDEGDSFVSIDCQENVGSYDPNDKQAFPVGYGTLHYITDSTDLEYLIRFQNTGTDTAFNIVIRDTISPHLNIETLRPGTTSHDYRYDIEASNIAVFHFENIMLPDSNVNEAASHGFIKFNIEQQADNPIGTLIENNAGIYFDFNEPIITNTVFHTIGEDFRGIVTSIITPPEVEEAGISVNVFPNPFDKYTRFEVQGEAVKELQLNVYDMVGRRVLQQHSTHQQHITIKRNDLPPGVYVFRLIDEKQQLATGKLIIR